eukprot:jgi/Botrbrau1/22440/Bobra.0091s0042.1
MNATICTAKANSQPCSQAHAALPAAFVSVVSQGLYCSLCGCTAACLTACTAVFTTLKGLLWSAAAGEAVGSPVVSTCLKSHSLGGLAAICRPDGSPRFGALVAIVPVGQQH